MTTNKEWLYSLEPDELTAWFDAEHVDAHSKAQSKDAPTLSEQSESLSDEADSRDKILADLEKQVRVWHDYDGNFMRIYDSVAYAQVKELLDRQAAITERELCKQCDWPSLAAQSDLESQERIAELTAQVDRLTDELEITRGKNKAYKVHIAKMQEGRNGWHIKAEQLQKQVDKLTNDCEQYRELLSKAITQAAEIANLQP